jgi:hypothetical protein
MSDDDDVTDDASEVLDAVECLDEALPDLEPIL